MSLLSDPEVRWGPPVSFTMPMIENSTSSSYRLPRRSGSAVKTSSYSPPQPRRRSSIGRPEASATSSTEGPTGMNESSISIPTPESAQRVFRAVPRPSERSMQDVTAPDLAIAAPSATLGMGT